MPSHPAIEDVVQEALVVLYRRLGNVRDPLAVAGWILRVVTRLFMLPVPGLIRGAAEVSERHGAEHFAQVSRDDLRIDLMHALESLPEMYREVILLRDMEQLTVGESAAHLGITRETCKVRIHRGRMLLREYLRPDTAEKGCAMTQFFAKSSRGLFATQMLRDHLVRGAIAFALLYVATGKQYAHPVDSVLAGLLPLAAARLPGPLDDRTGQDDPITAEALNVRWTARETGENGAAAQCRRVVPARSRSS